MRFEVEHRFSGSPRSVARLLADPSFYLGLDLPDLSTPELVEHRTVSEHSFLCLRFRFVGRLDPIARRLLGRRPLTWVQEIDVDHAANAGTLAFHAEADPGRLHGSAEFTIVSDGGGSVRRLAGELVVGVPVIGPGAERHILPGLLRRLDIESEDLERRLQP